MIRSIAARNVCCCISVRCIVLWLRFGIFCGANVAEGEIRRRVMSLERDNTGFGARAVASVLLVQRRFIYVVCDLNPVDPTGEMQPVRDSGHGEPLPVGRDDTPRRLAIVKATGSEIHRLRAVISLPLVPNLTL